MGVGQSPWTPNGTVDTTRSIITQCPLWHLLSIISCNLTGSQLNDDRNGGQYSFAFETAKKERNYSIYSCKENSKEKSVFETTQIWLNWGISPSTQCVGSHTWHQVCQGSSTEWRILSTVKNLQPYMYPVDTHMWLAEAKTFCLIWKKFSCIKIDGTWFAKTKLECKDKRGEDHLCVATS